MHFPPFVKVHTAALLPISGIMLNEKLHWKLSKFATFYEYKMSKLIFPFFISCYALYFLLVNILVFVEIEAFITLWEKTKYSSKGKLQLWVFVSYKIWQISKCFSSRQLISSHIQNFWWVSLYTVQHRQYNKIKLSFMTSIALLYKHCTSWGQKVSEHSGGHPCWKIIPIFFSRFFWLNGRERAIWWRYNVPHYYYSFYCPNSFMIETLLLQHSALKFEF